MRNREEETIDSLRVVYVKRVHRDVNLQSYIITTLARNHQLVWCLDFPLPNIALLKEARWKKIFLYVAFILVTWLAARQRCVPLVTPINISRTQTIADPPMKSRLSTT
jgi:hypothetical protein